MTLDICFSPTLFPFYKKDNDTVIVVDVFRASATICTALNNGASAIIPVADIEKAKEYKTLGFRVGAERNAQKCEFADFGNSPFDYTPETVLGKEIVLTTTNGTQALEKAIDAKHLLVGTFSNIDVLLEKCAQIGGRVLVLCAGWNNRVSMEDSLFGGAFAERLFGMTNVTFESDAIKIALELWQAAKPDPLSYLKNSDHYHRLEANGVVSDAEYCLRENSAAVVPTYDKKTKKLTNC